MTNHTYVQAWQDYRRRIRSFFMAWLGGFVAAAALAVVVNALEAPEWTFMALAAAWMMGCGRQRSMVHAASMKRRPKADAHQGAAVLARSDRI